MIVEVQYTITGKFKVDSDDIDTGMSFEDVKEAIESEPWEGDHDPRYDGQATITVTKLEGEEPNDLDVEPEPA